MSSLHICPACKAPLRYVQGIFQGGQHEREFTCDSCERTYTFVAPGWNFSLRQKLAVLISPYEYVVVKRDDG